MEAPLTESNSLPELAARVRAEHTAVADALKDSLRHAITAGELLIVAKAQVPHGQWFSWLREHCAISKRTEQFYMRAAKKRAEICIFSLPTKAILSMKESPNELLSL